MRRTARPTREERDNLEDTSWKRKSYALAQRNALPIPMPYPVYPPPKPCPPPAVVIRPSRLRSRPPGAGYRPPTGYRPPGSNQSPLRQNYHHQGQQPQTDRLPSLSEVSAGTGDFPLHKVPPPHRQLPTIQASPLETDGIPSSSPPEMTTFRTPPPTKHTTPPLPPGPPIAAFTHDRPYSVPDSPPRPNHHITSPTRPSNIPTSPLPVPPYVNSSPAQPANIPPSLSRPVDHPVSLPQLVVPQDTTGLRPPTTHPTFNTFHPEPATPQLPPPTTLPPQQTYNAPPTPPLPMPRTPPALPSKPPPRVVQPKGTKIVQQAPPPPSPAQKNSPLKKAPPSPRPREAPPAVPSYTSRQPESGYSSHDSLSTSPPESCLTESTPPLKHPQSLSKPVTPSEPASHSPPADTDSMLVSQEHEGSSLSPSREARPETDLSDPNSTGNTSGMNVLPEESKSPSVGSHSLEGESDLTPQVPKVSELHTPESKLNSSSPPADAASEPLQTTPPSQRRSSSPTPLPRQRTPPSIRAAPSWQPMFPATPLLRRANLASKSESSLSPPSSTTTPRPSIAPEGEETCLPTPPSSPSTARVDNVTPSPSSSSFPHGHGQSPVGEKEGEGEARHPESNTSPDDGRDPPRSSPTNKMPDKILPNAEKATPPTANAVNSSLPASEELGTVPAKPAQEAFQTYKTRFWILTVFSFICFLQTIVWGTFGPIAESAQAAFPSWDDATIAAFPNWGPIIVVVFTIPMVWLSERLGLQLAMVVCALFLTLGTMLRCFTSQEAVFTVLCHVSSVLFAFAACFTLSLPAMVAATWFPPSERITATAVGTLMCQLGAAAMYLGALVVRYPSTEPQDLSDTEREDIRGDIMVLMYIHFGAALLLFLAVVIYFPARPPTPPSASSAEERIDYFKAIKKIFRKKQLLMVMVVVAFSFGVPVVWIGVLNLSLKEIGIHQEQAIGVAVTAVVCSSASAFIAARITDKMYGHLKVTIMVLLGISSVFFLWFLLLTTKVIYPSLGQVYVAVTGGLCFEYTTVPLLVELAVEIGFPIPENVTGATLTFAFNLVALVFLGLFQIPNSSHLWVSCVLLACVSFSIIPLFFIKETHKRSDTDRKFI